MTDKNIVIIGSGIAGLSAAWFLNKEEMPSMIYEKRETYGGLCGGFVVQGFTFDIFAHLSFSKDTLVNEILKSKTEYIVHKPEAMNYTHGQWIRNPVQNNLYNINLEEKINIIKGYINRPTDSVRNDYENWLKMQYGNYFAENYPMRYTRKYWTVEAKKLETKWVKGRMYETSIDEMLRGAMTLDTPCVHYSKEMYYPAVGGFRAFLKNLSDNANIKYNKEVVGINPINQSITFADGEVVTYGKLISTIPLPELPYILSDIPDDVRNACEQLDYTSGLILSLGLKREIKAPAMWFYIYDEDIYPARISYPNVESMNNVPLGCSSLQAEIYFSKYKPLQKDINQIIEHTIRQLIEIGLINRENILFKNVRMEKYANIMFTPEIYNCRECIHQYLESMGIFYAGRFGEWDYLWSDQSLLSGRRAALRCLE